MTPIEELRQKWIKHERRIRKYASILEKSQFNAEYGVALGHADMLSQCRRELQESISLVIKPEDMK